MMAEIADVIPGQDVLATWGNEVRDRVVMRYTTQTALETAEPAAPDGSVRWADDAGLLVRSGGAWVKASVEIPTVLYSPDGVARWQITDNFGKLEALTSAATIQAIKGSAAFPRYSFVGDADTGVDSLADDQLDLIAGGASVLQVDSGGLKMSAGSSVQSSGGTDVFGVEAPSGIPTRLVTQATGGVAFDEALAVAQRAKWDTNKVPGGTVVGSFTLPKHPNRLARWQIWVTAACGFHSTSTDVSLAPSVSGGGTVSWEQSRQSVHCIAGKWGQYAHLFEVEIGTGAGDSTVTLTSVGGESYWRAAAVAVFKRFND